MTDCPQTPFNAGKFETFTPVDDNDQTFIVPNGDHDQRIFVPRDPARLPVEE